MEKEQIQELRKFHESGFGNLPSKKISHKQGNSYFKEINTLILMYQIKVPIIGFSSAQTVAVMKMLERILPSFKYRIIRCHSILSRLQDNTV